MEWLCGLGLLRAGGRQRTDSTHVLAAVRVLNRMEFVGEILRAALEALAAAEQVGRDSFTILEAAFTPGAPGWLREIPAVQVLRRAWVEQYHRPRTPVTA